MKTKWLLIGGAVAFLGILIGTATSRTAMRTARKSLATDRDSLSSEQTQPVGWVFGRLIGFPGADKPLIPRGSGGGYLHQPSTPGFRP